MGESRNCFHFLLSGEIEDGFKTQAATVSFEPASAHHCLLQSS